MGFLESEDAVKGYINENFPAFAGVVRTVEMDENRCRIMVGNASEFFPMQKTEPGKEQLVLLLADFSTRLMAYHSTGSTCIGNENITYLGNPEGNEFVIETTRMSMTIAANAAAYRSVVLDQNGSEIAISTASQAIEC